MCFCGPHGLPFVHYALSMYSWLIPCCLEGYEAALYGSESEDSEQETPVSRARSKGLQPPRPSAAEGEEGRLRFLSILVCFFFIIFAIPGPIK
jgi:hypothetical protein